MVLYHWSQSTRLVREGALGPLSFIYERQYTEQFVDNQQEQKTVNLAELKQSIRNKIPSFVQLYYWIYGDTYCEYLQDLEPYDDWIVDRTLERYDIDYHDIIIIKAYLYMKYNGIGVVWGDLNTERNVTGGYIAKLEDIELRSKYPNYIKHVDELNIRYWGMKGKIDAVVMANKKRKQLKQPLKNAHLEKIINSGIIHEKKESRHVFSKILEIESDLYKEGLVSPGLKKIISTYLPPRMNERKIFDEVYRDLNGFLKKIIDEEGWLFDNRLQFTTQLLLFSLGYITVKKVIADREKIISIFPVLHDELECYRIGIESAHAKRYSVICITSNLTRYLELNRINSVDVLQYHINNKLKYNSKLYNESLSIINTIYNQTSRRNTNEKESGITEVVDED